MPLAKFLQGKAFGPDEIAVLIQAFEEALSILKLDRADPAAEVVAKRIVELAQQGLRDPARLHMGAIESVSKAEARGS